jgi:flagellar basal-body rod protein FlgC
MDFFTAMKVSASGLSAQRMRLDVATSNLANAEATRGPDGQPYRRKDPVLQTVDFNEALAQAQAGGSPSSAQGVGVSEIVEDQEKPHLVYLPSHPDADAKGFVALPNVDPVHETVNMMTASRSYDANAAALETLKALAQKAIDIMR